jgi:hypothetical protein
MSEYQDPPERRWLPDISISGTVSVPAQRASNEAPLQPTNPYQVEALKLHAMGDLAGLRALDQQLDEAGYAPEGQVRAFIATILAGA